jgi:hypothetical protein
MGAPKHRALSLNYRTPGRVLVEVPAPPPDLIWLRSRWSRWTFSVKDGIIRAERPGYPVSTSPSDTLLGLILLGLEAWDCRDRTEGN